MAQSSSTRRVLERLGLGLVLLALAAYLLRGIRSAWDFETFYYAATALRRGLDPYRLEALTAVAGKDVPLPFLYPPATLALFLPFTWLPVQTAAAMWLGIKLALAGVLVALWRRFLPGVGLLPLALVGLLAFNSAMLWDLRTGNVSLLEQALLWAAFAGYAQDRRRLFAGLVVLASIFKLQPIVFLGLLLAPSGRHGPNRVLALGALALFAGLAFLPTLLGFPGARGFLAGPPAERPFGEINPCALGLFDSLLGPASAAAPGTPDTALLLWGAYCGILLVVSRGTLRRAWARRDPAHWVVIACLVYALVAPRMMIYSYLVLVPPTLLLVRAWFPSGGGRALALLPVLAQGSAHYLRRVAGLPPLSGLPFLAEIAVTNLSFLLTLGMWLRLLRADRGPRPRRHPGGRAPRGKRERTSLPKGLP